METITDKSPKHRPMYFILAAIKTAKDGTTSLLSENIETRDRDEAVKAFKTKNKIEPELVQGPWYEVKGTSTSETVRLSVSIPAKNLDFTKSRWQGEYDGWRVYVTGLVGGKANDGSAYKDDELVLLTFDSAIVAKTPKPRFGGAPAVVRRENMENASKM